MSSAQQAIRPRRGRDVSARWLVLDGLVWLFRNARLHRLGRATGYVMILPALAVVGVLAAGLAYLTWIAFHKFDAYLFQQGGLSTRNFSEAIRSGYYRNIFVRTLEVSAAVTVAALIVALALAYTMVRSRSRWGRIGLLVVVFLPFLVGEVVRAYSWLVMIGGNGAVPWLTGALGLGKTSLLGTAFGVSLGLMQLMLPLCALTLLPAIHAIDPELEQAAAVMGARSWQTWRHVILPLARPGLAAAAAVSFTLSMTAYATPALLGNGEYDFIANTIQLVYFGHSNQYLGSAMGVLVLIGVTIGVTIIFWVGNRHRAGERRTLARLQRIVRRSR
jgi:putative spermidine/putrescine transport system permease protein